MTADIYVRNPVNLAGADIRVTTDDTCLKIVDRQQGSLLPGPDGNSFSPLSEIKDHETRLAVAITDRTKSVSTDGVFYQLKLQVTCASGIGSVTVGFAELSSYADPNAPKLTMVPNTMSAGTLNVVNAQLAIGPVGQVTAIPTQPVPTSSAPIQSTPLTQAQPPLIPAIAIIILVTVVIFAALVIVNRRRSSDE